MSEANVRRAIADLRRERADAGERRSLDGVLEYALEFELINGLLYRKVYDSVDMEVQLRLCVPSQDHSKFEMPGRGEKGISYRSRLILEYHNGRLGGHVGRERTYEMLSKDFWWPGMYESVRRWCRNC